MFIDAHTHLDHYEETLDAAIAEIEQHHILTVSNSMDIPSARLILIYHPRERINKR